MKKKFANQMRNTNFVSIIENTNVAKNKSNFYWSKSET